MGLKWGFVNACMCVSHACSSALQANERVLGLGDPIEVILQEGNGLTNNPNR